MKPQITVTPTRRFGLEQWSALVTDPATDAVLYRVTRWSESAARADAVRWTALHLLSPHT